jgi:hypothetical protein
VRWGAPTANYSVRADVPRDVAQAGLLGITFSVSEANAGWTLQAVKATYEPSSGDITR